MLVENSNGDWRNPPTFFKVNNKSNKYNYENNTRNN